MSPYIVLYRDSSLRPADGPFIFTCLADDGNHAEEQCANAYDCFTGFEVVWVYQGYDTDMALTNYYNCGESN
mgnify:CR=1 FL=1